MRAWLDDDSASSLTIYDDRGRDVASAFDVTDDFAGQLEDLTDVDPTAFDPSTFDGFDPFDVDPSRLEAGDYTLVVSFDSAVDLGGWYDGSSEDGTSRPPTSDDVVVTAAATDTLPSFDGGTESGDGYTVDVRDGVPDLTADASELTIPAGMGAKVAVEYYDEGPLRILSRCGESGPWTDSGPVEVDDDGVATIAIPAAAAQRTCELYAAGDQSDEDVYYTVTPG
jgi:hypothetical protein